MEVLFSAWLEALAERYGDAPAVTCGGTLSYQALLDASRQSALHLAGMGVRKGERVVLWAVNGLDWLVAFFGITMAGGVATLMNYGLPAADVTQLTKRYGASWAIVGTNKVSAADPEAVIQAMVNGGVAPDRILRADALFSAATDADAPLVDLAALRALAAQTQPRDTQVIIFTTGTMSFPKAVQLSSYSILSDARCFTDLCEDGMLTDSLCVALPLFHSYGLAMVMFWLQNGGHIHLMAAIHPAKVLEAVSQNGITGIATVSVIYSGLLHLPDAEKKLAGQVKVCFVGGGFTTPTEMMRVENALGSGKFLIGYGQTECSPVITVNVPSDPLERRAVSVGRVLPGLDVRIWREGAGFLPQGEIGEIVVKGPITMNGYLGLPQEEQPFDADGWLHTGDLGLFDETGLLLLAGRIKDIIIRNGENISPMEIETALMEEPSVREAKVMGAPHPLWGESVEACVVYGAEPPDEDALRAALRGKLAAYKIPSHFFAYPALPLNTNGKLDQRTLKVSMLEKLRGVYIENALNEGLRILRVRVGNRGYTITPVCDMVQGMARQLGFSEKLTNRIRLATEEMLTERIENAYDENGEIRLELFLLPDRFRVRFTDGGRPYRFDGENASVSARIILANVDAFSSVAREDNLVGSNLDWQYAEDFDVNAYLLRNREKGKA